MSAVLTVKKFQGILDLTISADLHGSLAPEEYLNWKNQFPFVVKNTLSRHYKRPLGWWNLRLSAKILALLRLSINFFQLRLTIKLKINVFVSKS